MKREWSLKMETNFGRRRFMGSILALGIAPAFVRVDSLMRLVPFHDEWISFRIPYWISGGATWNIANGIILPYEKLMGSTLVSVNKRTGKRFYSVGTPEWVTGVLTKRELEIGGAACAPRSA